MGGAGDRLLSSKHLTYSAISFVVIALFCVGFPLAVLISSHRAKAANSEAAARFVSLLTASYKPGFYYFEAVDLARKLLTSSVLITISPRHRLQLFCGTLMSVLSAATFIGCRPYRKPLFNFLQGIAHVQISSPSRRQWSSISRTTARRSWRNTCMMASCR